YGALAANAVTGGAVEHLGNVVVGGDRGAAAAGELLDRLQALGLRPAVLERPELGRQHPRRRLEQRRGIDVIGAEARAVFAQRRPRGLVETFDLLGDLLSVEHAQRLVELKRDPARDAADVLGGG